MIPVSKFGSRRGARVRLICLHTSEGARDVRSLAAYLNRPGVNASYHGAVDDNRYEAYVDYSNAAWALRNGNLCSDNLCLCGFAGWTRAEWLRHPRMLAMAGAWLAERCHARGVPLQRLTDEQTALAVRNPGHVGGIIDHWTYTRATKDGTHWDVGGLFPWDVVMRHAMSVWEEIAMPTEDQIRRIVREELHRAIWAPVDREGAGQSGQTSLGAIVRWWDHAQVLMRGEVTKLGERLDRIEGIIRGVIGPKDPT